MLPLRELFGLGALIVLVVAIAVRQAKRRVTFSGYQGIRKDVLRLSRVIRGEVSRDADGLAVTGNYEKWPVSVRFSLKNSGTVAIQMKAPANFHMTIQARGDSNQEGRTRISTQDAQFDSKFTTMTNTPTQARLFVRTQGAMTLIKSCCSSSGSLVRIVPGFVEVLERSFSQPEVYGFVTNHFQTMTKLAGKLLEMPGAEEIKIIPYPGKKQSPGLRIAVSAGLALAVFVAIRLPKADATNSQHFSEVSIEGISPADAALIGNASKWRLVQESDFDPDAASWLRSEGITSAGKIAADFSGKNDGRDAAYILTNTDKMIRVVIISQGVQVYDQRYQEIALAVKVPHSALSGAAWKDRRPEAADGDGLLIVGHFNDHASGVIFTLHDHKIAVQIPEDFQRLNLF